MMKWPRQAFVFLLSSLLATTTQAELLKVQQTTFGMDCAPCAYSIERGLNGLTGVRKVEVSLNQSQAVVELAPGNQVTLDTIQQVIRDGGFSPREATIEMIGRLSSEQGKTFLKLESGDRYRLAAEENDKGLQQQLQALESGQQIQVAGRVPPSEPDSQHPLTLYAQRLEIRSANRQ